MTEQELISLLTKGIPREAKGLRVGIGDDCAVINGDGFDWLVTTDALLEGVHFQFEYTGDVLLGRKALSANLSDIAAMGGEPLFYTVSIGVPQVFQVERLEALYKGMQEIADEFHVLLIGGDTCSSQSGLVISITAMGRVARGKACLRRGASPGDAVYVTGTLGESALGLKCLQRGYTDLRFGPYLDRHRNPAARLDAGQWLMSTEMVTSMIDISDGLLADLGHISESSNVGFEIHARSLRLAKEFVDCATELALDPLELALTGGEDYELAFTIAKDEISNFERLLHEKEQTFGHFVTCIGSMTQKPQDRLVFDLQERPISLKRTGYDHFYKP